MRGELAERLRDANPVRTPKEVAPDESLLVRIIAEPQHPRKHDGRHFRRRRALTILAAAVILIGGLAAAASKFAPEYFGSDDREPTPAAVLAQLREDPIPGGLGAIEERGLVRLAAFDTESGHATIYAAPMRAGSGFCSVAAIGEQPGGVACSDGQNEKTVPHLGHGSSEWGDVRVLLGRLDAPAASIDLRFEDGAVRAASVRAPWWIYIVGGDEAKPGRRPIQLTAVDPGGAVVTTQRVDPYFFTSRQAAEALLPESDGSPGQNAIRAVLKGLGTGPWLEQERVEIDRTRLLRRIDTDEGRVDVYTAPWGAGGVCFGYASSIPGFEPLITGCPANRPIADQPTRFDRDLIGVVRLAPSVFMIDGTPPRGAARTQILFEDGTSAPPDISVASSFIAWLGPERLERGHQAAELVALDAAGRTIASLPLEPGQFTSG